MINLPVKDALLASGWFRYPGAYVLMGGGFGSEGKGLMASVLAEACSGLIDVVTTNAGPNSGHTAYSTIDDQPFVTQQIPVAAVVLNQLQAKNRPLAYMNGGSIIDPATLMKEAGQYKFSVNNLMVHPNAAVIEPVDVETETEGAVAAIATTGKGTGSALARKIMRQGNVIKARRDLVAFFSTIKEFQFDWRRDRVMVETAQGFSLGINSRFYPYTTSRECTVMQAIADARIPYNKVQKVIACYRTFPIRVGNTDKGTSGSGYSDQKEIKWEDIGVQPELTTVTKRIRRVFTWSWEQFEDSVRVNQPDVVFVNFCNYLEPIALRKLLEEIFHQYVRIMGKIPLILTGFGPRNSDVSVWNG